MDDIDVRVGSITVAPDGESVLLRLNTNEEELRLRLSRFELKELKRMTDEADALCKKQSGI